MAGIRVGNRKKETVPEKEKVMAETNKDDNEIAEPDVQLNDDPDTDWDVEW